MYENDKIFENMELFMLESYANYKGMDEIFDRDLVVKLTSGKKIYFYSKERGNKEIKLFDEYKNYIGKVKRIK